MTESESGVLPLHYTSMSLLLDNFITKVMVCQDKYGYFFDELLNICSKKL